MRVAEIGQVADLHALVEDGVLHLDEVADMHVLGQFRAGAEPGEGTDARAARDVAAFEMAEGQDLGFRLHRRLGAEDDMRPDDRVAPDHCVMAQEDRLGRGQRHAVGHDLGAKPVLQRRLRPGQIGAAVHAQRLGLGAGHDLGGHAVRTRGGDDVGQVVFARGIVPFQFPDQTRQDRDVGADDAAVAKGYLAFLIGRVLVFDDPVELAQMHDEPAVARRFGGLEPEHDDVRLRVQHRAERLGPDQRRVAVKHDHAPLEAFERGQGLHHRMAGPVLLLLDHHLDAFVEGLRGAGHRLGPVARDDHRPLRPDRGARHHRMDEKRRARDPVQHLGQVRIHPGALSRGKNDERCGHVAASLCVAPVLTKAPVAARGR